MQSTGEVIGLHTDPRVALAKAMQGAALIPPRPGADGALALISVAERDHGELPRVAARPGSGRVPVRGHRGHGRGTAWAGVRGAGRGQGGREAAQGTVPILELIASGTVRLVVNTPSPKSGAGPGRRRDPPGRDRGGDPVPDRDRDRRRRRGGPGPGPARAAGGGPVAGRVDARSGPATGPGRAAGVAVS